MAGRLAVAAVLLLRLGGAHGTRDCEDLHQVVVVGEGRKETICEEKRKGLGRYSASTTLYVKPGDDFEGVSLEVKETNIISPTSQVAWFGLDKCYSDKWINLTVSVEATNILNRFLYFTLNTEEYSGICTRKTSWNKKISGFSIVAHGSSSWTSTPKETGGRCDGPEEFTNLQNPPTCTDRPRPAAATTTTSTPAPSTTTTSTRPPSTIATTTTTSTPPLSTITITTTTTTAPEGTATTTTTISTTGNPVVIAVPIAVVVAVILAIVVCVAYRRRRRGQASQETGLVRITENSMYQPVPGPVTPAAREHQGTVVVENSLYERFSGPVTPAATEQQGTVVVENSLYEPVIRDCL